MNKKSLILATILLGGLLTPQETKPTGVEVIFNIAIVGYGVLLYDMLGFSNPLRTKNKISDYTKEQDAIKLYSTNIHIYKKEKIEQKNLLKIQITDVTSQGLFDKIISSTQKFENQKRVYLSFKPSIILHSNKICILQETLMNEYTKKSLINILERTFLLKKNKRTIFGHLTRALVFSSSLIIIPALTIAMSLNALKAVSTSLIRTVVR